MEEMKVKLGTIILYGGIYPKLGVVNTVVGEDIWVIPVKMANGKLRWIAPKGFQMEISEIDEVIGQLGPNWQIDYSKGKAQ